MSNATYLADTSIGHTGYTYREVNFDVLEFNNGGFYFVVWEYHEPKVSELSDEDYFDTHEEAKEAAESCIDLELDLFS